MNRTNLAAYTETSYPGTSYPAYLSLNREDDGRIVLSARERGGDGNKSVRIEIPPRDLIAFCLKASAECGALPCSCGEGSSCGHCDPGG